MGLKDMDDLNAVNDARQAVVEPAADTKTNGGSKAGTPAFAANAQITERRQSAAENSGFRRIRLENEAYKREIDSLRAQLARASELEKYKEQSDIYLSKLVDGRMQADLEAIQKLDPTVTDLESLGGEFLRVIENGVDAKVAFSAVRAANEGSLSRRPPETGAVGVAEEAQCEFFSSKELDRLTSRDLENPLIFKKAMKSLKRL